MRVCDKLVKIIEKGTFQIYLQPIVDISNHQVMGYEVLNRIENVDMESFYRMIAKCGMTHYVDSMILQRVLPLTKKLGSQIFVNVYPSTVLKFPFSDYGCSQVVFELTEQEEVDDLGEVSKAVSDLGLTISLDDVGVGYSNLTKLIDLKPNYIKLDRKLIDHIDDSLDKQDLVAALLSFSKSRFQVIAEGIEREEELQVLKELGIPLGQGYLLGKPELWQEV